MQSSANSLRLFHHTSESFSERKDIGFLMAPSVRSRWLDIGRLLFLRCMELDSVSVYKNARKQRSHIDQTSLMNNGLIIWQTDLALTRIKNDRFLFVFLYSCTFTVVGVIYISTYSISNAAVPSCHTFVNIWKCNI